MERGGLGADKDAQQARLYERWTVHSYLAFATRASWQPPRTDAVCVCLPTLPPSVYLRSLSAAAVPTSSRSSPAHQGSYHIRNFPAFRLNSKTIALWPGAQMHAGPDHFPPPQRGDPRANQ